MTTQTTTEWAIENGVHHSGYVALDNYEPAARSFARIECFTYDMDDDRGSGWVISDVTDLRDAHKAIYLMDDGRTVQPFYVAAWHPEGEHVILHPFPTNVDGEGNPRIRPDNGRPVDFDTWQLGPRRCYHVKLRKLSH